MIKESLSVSNRMVKSIERLNGISGITLIHCYVPRIQLSFQVLLKVVLSGRIQVHGSFWIFLRRI